MTHVCNLITGTNVKSVYHLKVEVKWMVRNMKHRSCLVWYLHFAPIAIPIPLFRIILPL